MLNLTLRLLYVLLSLKRILFIPIPPCPTSHSPSALRPFRTRSRKPSLLKEVSDDVLRRLHDFWVPELRFATQAILWHEQKAGVGAGAQAGVRGAWFGAGGVMSSRNGFLSGPSGGGDEVGVQATCSGLGRK